MGIVEWRLLLFALLLRRSPAGAVALLLQRSPAKAVGATAGATRRLSPEGL